MRHVAILVGHNGLFPDHDMERGADGVNTGYAFPDRLCEVVRWSVAGHREAAHDLFDAHLPPPRYEQRPGVGLVVRGYLPMRRELIACDLRRRPATTLSMRAKAEVEHLPARLALHDRRAAPATP